MRKIAGVKDFKGKVDGGGVKDGSGKIPMGCMPPQSLMVIGAVYGYGLRKYSRNNWMRGYYWTESYDALQRHLNAWYAGEDYDRESKLPHLAHAAWHVISLLYWSLKGKLYEKFDDRPFV